MMRSDIKLRKILPEDWSWIEVWFRDETLDRELGPIDRDWLNIVLSQNDGVQLIALDVGEPVALVGCTWSMSAEEPHGITDIAIAPHRRRSGLGRRVMAEFLHWRGHPPGDDWVAFVAPGNSPACRFLSSIGWRRVGLNDGMYRFEWTRKPRNHDRDADGRAAS